MTRLPWIVHCLAIVTEVQAQATKIVVIGATTRERFNQEIAERPVAERDYFAWAQGFMSAALIRAPDGVDKDLDLAPPSMPLNAQADFIRAYCVKNPEQDDMDAVHALYRRLRGPDL
ncbi:hypothetical protein U8607_07855 [Methylobacterium durans]|uniref:hypothetical protein n=1 Tax=Methylobacterium durans TaxID=2202825 RepID=UPI002AFF5500|nr:hypothetical protein [Methylobacterium durans]MEA1831997.1 hypothetical protein [Methylobacterium durans]